MAEPLSLQTLSKSMSRLFQELLHISFLQYLKTLRMLQAIGLLLESRQSISGIAFQAGYHTIGSLSNAFFGFIQAGPSDFRKN